MLLLEEALRLSFRDSGQLGSLRLIASCDGVEARVGEVRKPSCRLPSRQQKQYHWLTLVREENQEVGTTYTDTRSAHPAIAKGKQPEVQDDRQR